MTAATIVHFEIPADNIERANKFYGGLFGWKIEKVPEMDYWMFRTGAGNGEQVMGGGIMSRHYPQEPITIYISVDSVAEYSKKVEGLGGKVTRPKTEVPGHGWFAVCTDTENNAFALWENNPQSQQQ